MRRCHRAVSMIEILVALSVTGVILVAGVGMIHELLSVERFSRQSVLRATAVSRLSRYLRHDAHGAIAGELVAAEGDEPPRLELSMPEEAKVVYQAIDGRLTRLQQEDGQVRHRDEFVFPDRSRIELQLEQKTNRAVAVIEHPPSLWKSFADQSVQPPRRLVRIEASLGRDHRWKSGGKTLNVQTAGAEAENEANDE